MVQTPIHWEAVLVTAIPATIAGVFSLTAAIVASRAARVGRANKQHLQAIDAAVNGVDGDAPTLRETVEQINTTLNGPEAK